ncbi:MAG: phospholipase [Planctomycetes bacterium]|nr:phospholipase [Planctomycetota bacterium]MBI3843904.1 phospholipase [Planctomycetota bacterium]
MSNDANDRMTPRSNSTRRRRFLQGSMLATGLLVLAGFLLRASAGTPPPLPDPTQSGIEHVVVVTMENRSFDHYLGWMPTADGRQQGLAFADSNGVAHTTHRLTDFQECSHPDPDHSYAGGRVEFNGGACDGWLRAGGNDNYSIGFYKPRDVLFIANAAARWTVCDRYFAAIMAETFPNRLYMHSAQTDRIDGSLSFTTLPTIWDRLADAGLEGRYYFSDAPFLALWGSRYSNLSRSVTQFFDDAASGSLPALSFVEPRFIDPVLGTGGDDHPHNDIRNGEAFLYQVYRAVVSSPEWPHTVLVITYDEWGGFFDHVPPTAAPIPPADVIAGNQDGLRGFRVPCIVVSPWSHHQVSSLELDHTSILRMIEWRWNLPPLTVRDASANNMAAILDFANPNFRAKRNLDIPSGPFGIPCPLQGVAPAADKWSQLRAIATATGWPQYE